MCHIPMSIDAPNQQGLQGQGWKNKLLLIIGTIIVIFGLTYFIAVGSIIQVLALFGALGALLLVLFKFDYSILLLILYFPLAEIFH